MENPLVSSSSALSRKRKTKKKTQFSVSDESYVSDDIIIEILSRLSTKQVLRSRCVCRRWRDLTSTRDFTHLHLQRCFPMILKDHKSLVTSMKDHKSLLISLWEPTRARSKIYGADEPYHEGIIMSHNGLILAREYGGHMKKFIIYNPIYKDVVNKIVPTDRKALGVFFHPVQKEYCTLWQITQFHEPRKTQYKILNLESNPVWREITNPYSQHVVCERSRTRRVSLVLIGEYIYWMCERYQDAASNCDIMQYDTRKEEFRMIPCPIPIHVTHHNYNLNLIDIDGVVSLVEVSPSKELTIWSLKDEGDRLWTSSKYIIGYGLSGVLPLAIAFWNGDLVLQSDGRLYAYNLKSGALKNFGRKYGFMERFLSHTTSLVSPRNFKSEIRMEDDYNQ